MTSRSSPDWLVELLSHERDARPISATERDELAEALAAAVEPQPLDEDLNGQLIQRALQLPGTAASEDPLGPASIDEIRAAEATRMSLETDPLVMALRAAHHPAPLEPTAQRQRIEAVVGARRVPRTSAVQAKKVWFWSTTSIAAAAGFWFYLSSESPQMTLKPAPLARLELAHCRTTQPLFNGPFENTRASQRIDRIAQVRAQDLRDNRYALWGVK